MTLRSFEQLLKKDRTAAIRLLMTHKVQEWLNDGPGEVARVLTLWAEDKLDLGDDVVIAGLAEGMCEDCQ